MNRKKLQKLEAELRDIRKSPRNVSGDDLVRIASALGRARANVGKEPTYVREGNPRLRPLSIPGHKGDLKIGTCRAIVDSLLDDVDEWKQMLDQLGEDDDDGS